MFSNIMATKLENHWSFSFLILIMFLDHFSSYTLLDLYVGENAVFTPHGEGSLQKILKMGPRHILEIYWILVSCIMIFNFFKKSILAQALLWGHFVILHFQFNYFIYGIHFYFLLFCTFNVIYLLSRNDSFIFQAFRITFSLTFFNAAIAKVTSNLWLEGESLALSFLHPSIGSMTVEFVNEIIFLIGPFALVVPILQLTTFVALVFRKITKYHFIIFTLMHFSFIFIYKYVLFSFSIILLYYILIYRDDDLGLRKRKKTLIVSH